MKILFEYTGNIGEASFKIFEHSDAPGEGIVEIERGGVSESQLNPMELDLLASACTRAANKLRGKN